VEPSADTDGDGLPDTWEFAWFGSINSPIGAPGADPDRDSHDNRHEFLAGTGPLDSSSVLRIVDARSDESGVQVRFTSVAGKGYRVERSAQLGGPWNTIIDLVPGTGGVMQVTDSESPQTGQRFYRLRLAP
jgi:hypothetical protein